MQRYDGKDARFHFIVQISGFYWPHAVRVTKPRLRRSPLGSRSHSLLCVWHNNKSKALNLKVSFNTISKTNFHLFVSAIYHLHLIQLCALHQRINSAGKGKVQGDMLRVRADGLGFQRGAAEGWGCESSLQRSGNYFGQLAQQEKVWEQGWDGERKGKTW